MNNSLTESEPVEDTTAKDDGEIHSGVGVLDKTVKILDALESGPSTLGQLVAATGLARPTAHRLAIALERHRFVLRDQHGRFVLGSRFAELAAAAGEDRLLTAAGPILQTLLDRTGESAQIYRRQGDQRVCIAAVERTSGLRDSIPVGAMLSMEAGSAAQILLAWEDSDRLHQGLRHAKFTATKLAADVQGGLSSVFLLWDPAGFEESTGSLRYLDGTLPAADSDEDWWNMVYKWDDCPVLAGLDLGDYGPDTTQSRSGSSQEYMSQFYVGMRGAWNSGTADNLAGGEEFWQKLTEGAVSTAAPEG